MSSLVDSAGRIPLPRVEVGSVHFDPLDLEAAATHVRDALARGAGGRAVVVDADLHRQLARRPRRGRAHTDALPDATLVLAGFAAAVWASRLVGPGLPGVVSVPALAESLCAACSADGRRVFLIGGVPGGHGVPSAAQRAAAVLGLRHRGLRVAGCASPAGGFGGNRAASSATIRDAIQAKPELVLVSASTPVQERIIGALRRELPGAWLFGCHGFVEEVVGARRRRPRRTGYAARMLIRAAAGRLYGWAR